MAKQDNDKTVIEGDYEEQPPETDRPGEIARSATYRTLAIFICVILAVVAVLMILNQRDVVPAADISNGASKEQRNASTTPPPETDSSPPTPDMTVAKPSPAVQTPIQPEPSTVTQEVTETPPPPPKQPSEPPARPIKDPASTTQQPAAIPADAAMRELRSRIATLEARMEARREAMATLQDELSELRESYQATLRDARHNSDILKRYTRFKALLLDGKPYRTELQALLQASGLPEAIAAKLRWFQDHSKDGLPTLTTLKQQFNQALYRYYNGPDAATDRSETGTTTHSMWQRLKEWGSGLVQIRKVGSSHTDDSDTSILARAESYVRQGNIGMALEEIRRLSVKTAPHFSQWRKQATSYRQARDYIKTIEASLFDAL